MSTVKERKDTTANKQVKKDNSQKAIILTVDTTLDERYAKKPVSPKTESLRKAFSESPL